MKQIILLLALAVAAQATTLQLLSGVSPLESNLFGPNVLITPVPVWYVDPEAKWISYANTGLGGFSPPNWNLFPSPDVPTGVFFQDFENDDYGGTLTLTTYADDTAMVLLDGEILVPRSLVQGVNCTKVGIGCLPGHGVTVTAAFGPGYHELELDVLQLWNDGFGVLYNGLVTFNDEVPEPVTWLLVGGGLVGLGWWKRSSNG